jgi:alpha-galactosidase
MKRLTRVIAALVAATPLVLVGAITNSPAAQAATAYPPGGPDQTPVMAWSSWSFLRLGANAAQVKGEAKALVSTGLAAAGYHYVNLDDGWYQCPGSQGPNVDANGRWVVNAANYPSVGSQNGIQALAAYVHSLGLKFGIYETAGISSQAVSKNTPILGTSDTASQIATTTSQNNYNCGGMMAINYNAPGAQAYVDSEVNELASWGVDYIKLDGITDQNGPDIKAWQTAIQQSGRPMVLDATEGSFTTKLAPTLDQYANQWEFSPDIEINGPDEGSATNCGNEPYTGCLSVFPLTGYSTWDDRFDAVATWQPYGGPGGFNDYDSIEVGDGSADSGMSLAASGNPAQPLVAGLGAARPWQ